MKKLLMTLVFSLIASTGFAVDYVDNINNSNEKCPEGHRVVYEMNVGSFTTEGTFAAAQVRLQELKSLGVDVVWLMPIYPRGGGINSPYAATNFQQTNPNYGTIADLKAFVASAHELQMEVWLDWVPNHTATNADWVTTHPEYYAKSGGQMIHPNNYGDVWQLDYDNADLVNAMNDCLKFWIDQADIDGYRCDYISSPKIPASYWQTTIPMIKAYKAQAVGSEAAAFTFLGEADIASDATRLKTVGFDYDYAWQFQSSLANYGTSATSARLKAFINTLLEKSADLSFGRMLYVTNHDQNYNEEKKTLTQKYGANRYPLTVLAYTVYGMPLIYNGQETGGNQALDYFNDTKINWTTKDDKMLNTLRTLFALKHDVPALGDARLAADNPVTTVLNVTGNTGVLAYTRTLGDSQVLVVLNMATTAVTATVDGIAAGDWSLWLDSETIAQGTSRQQTTLSASHTFSLAAKGYRVYVRGTFPEQTVTPTAILSPVQSEAKDDQYWFDLSGRALSKPTKPGLYIHGRRKTLVR
ncbi:alpha-amylase family glycosyl hydrolase [Prevotella sp. P6B4]|uniref:alpha-amylase family glycosyl hydrolase n=1 Tax=Prevotella sp. P6B4 TaxID=1410614 RepID=UPI0004910B71|nr:alpha-amylase family glycosyl hydrolase [Prevotella sp. P6B4]